MEESGSLFPICPFPSSSTVRAGLADTPSQTVVLLQKKIFRKVFCRNFAAGTIIGNSLLLEHYLHFFNITFRTLQILLAGHRIEISLTVLTPKCGELANVSRQLDRKTTGVGMHAFPLPSFLPYVLHTVHHLIPMEDEENQGPWKGGGGDAKMSFPLLGQNLTIDLVLLMGKHEHTRLNIWLPTYEGSYTT